MTQIHKSAVTCVPNTLYDHDLVNSTIQNFGNKLSQIYKKRDKKKFIKIFFSNTSNVHKLELLYSFNHALKLELIKTKIDFTTENLFSYA